MRSGRRQLLKTGVAGGVLLWASSGWVSRAPFDPAAPWTVQRTLALRRVASAIIGDALPEGSARQSRLDATVAGIQFALAGLPPALRDEFSDLLNLMTLPLTRWLLLRLPADWDAVSDADIRIWLTRWLASPVALFQSASQALIQLVHGAWYGQAANWQQAGYPGPPLTILQARSDT